MIDSSLQERDNFNDDREVLTENSESPFDSHDNMSLPPPGKGVQRPQDTLTSINGTAGNEGQGSSLWESLLNLNQLWESTHSPPKSPPKSTPKSPSPQHDATLHSTSLSPAPSPTPRTSKNSKSDSSLQLPSPSEQLRGSGREREISDIDELNGNRNTSCPNYIRSSSSGYGAIDLCDSREVREVGIPKPWIKKVKRSNPQEMTSFERIQKIQQAVEKKSTMKSSERSSENPIRAEEEDAPSMTSTNYMSHLMTSSSIDEETQLNRIPLNSSNNINYNERLNPIRGRLADLLKSVQEETGAFQEIRNRYQARDFERDALTKVSKSTKDQS